MMVKVYGVSTLTVLAAVVVLVVFTVKTSSLFKEKMVAI
jgi:hypothetical protein